MTATVLTTRRRRAGLIALALYLLTTAGVPAVAAGLAGIADHGDGCGCDEGADCCGAACCAPAAAPSCCGGEPDPVVDCCAPAPPPAGPVWDVTCTCGLDDPGHSALPGVDLHLRAVVPTCGLPAPAVAVARSADHVPAAADLAPDAPPPRAR